MAEPAIPVATKNHARSLHDGGVDDGGSRSHSRNSDATHSYVLSRIETAQAALWRAELTRRILTILIAMMAVGLAWLVLDQWIYSPGTIGRSMFAAGIVFIIIVYGYLRLWPLTHFRISEDYAARALERDHPELGHALSSYVSLRRQRAEHPQGQLAQRVIQSVGNTAASKLRLIVAVPSEATGLVAWWATTIALIAALAAYTLASPKNSVQSVERLLRPMAALEAPKRVRISEVSPGDTEILAGRNLVVAATVANLRRDEPVYFHWVSNLPNSDVASRDSIRLLPSDLGEGPNRFVASVPISHHAQGRRQYRIVAGDANAGPYVVSIRDTPVVQIREAIYDPPAYTGKPRHTSRTGALHGIDGTHVELVATVNRPIVRAVIEFNPRKVGRNIQATAGSRDMQIAADGTTIRYEFPLRLRAGAAIALQDYRLRVWNDADQPNADPIVYPIKIVEDLPPEITIVVPQQSTVDVPINGQQEFEIHAADVDFGLAEIEVEIRRGIDLIARSSLWKDSKGKQGKQVAEYRFRPSRIIVAGRADGLGGARGSGLNVGDELELVAIATDNRIDPNDDMLVAGVTKTPPVRLRITAAIAGQQEKGMGEEETGGENGSKGETGEQGQGEQGQGEQGQGEQGQGEQGQGEQGQGEQGQGEQGQGEQGQGEQGQGEQGQGEQGQGEQGQGEQGQGEQGQGEQGQGEQGQGEQGQGEQGQGEQGQGEQGQGEQGQGEPGQGEPDTGQQGETGSDGAPQSRGENASKGLERDGAESSGSGSDDESASDGEESEGENQTPKGNSKTRTGEQGGSSQSDPSEPPQDDAEAFERIQDYLKQNQQNEQATDSPKGEGQSPSDQSDQGQNGTQQGAAGQSAEKQSEEKFPGEGTRDKPGTGHDGQNQSGEDVEEMGGQSPSDQAQGRRGENASSANNEDGGRDRERDPEVEEGNGGQGKGGDQRSQTTDSTEGDASSSNAESTAGEGGSQDSDGQEGMSREGEGQTPEGQAREGKTGEGKTDELDKSSGNPGEENQSAGDQGDPSSSDAQDGKGADGSRSGAEAMLDTSDSPASKSDQDQSGTSDNSSQANQSGDSIASQEPSEPESSRGGGGSQSSGGSENEPTIDDELPDPVDLEYTKAATDLVLDYLDETRTDPDPDLLQRLKWTEQDLRRFRERWQNVKPVDEGPRSGAASPSEIEEALRSLGMRPPQTTQSSRRDSADALRGLRDSGNRRPAPADVRDAFDAFRRGIGRSSNGTDN